MSGRQKLGEVRDRYQVAAEKMVDYFRKDGIVEKNGARFTY